VEARGLARAYVSEEMARDLPAEMLDADGLFCNQRTHLSTIAYNSKTIAPADAPKGFADLLDPKYAGKMVKAHPGYSGTIMTATHQIARALGWSYFEKLAKQRVLQVQSATEPPKRIEAGERAVAVDGSDYLFWMAKERGAPVEVVFAAEGTPQISNPMGIFKSAPNPNAARLMVSWIMSGEGQSFIVNLSGQYPANKQVKVKAGRPGAVADQDLQGRSGRGRESRPTRSRRSTPSTSRYEPRVIPSRADQIRARASDPWLSLTQR
jgi:iron(III) transport system substrate-binding protein